MEATSKAYRVKACGNCGAKNILAAPESETSPVLVCPKCGEHPGTISSYSDCPHNPVHAYNERGMCVRAQAKTRKRHKQVFSTGEIPHLWAHRVQESARNTQGNLYFDGDTIYSYGGHFPIAVHVTNKRGRKAVLFNSARRSVTTSGHQNSVRGAIPKNVPVFTVFAVTNPPDAHKRNLRAYQTDLEHQIARTRKARTLWAKKWKAGEDRQLRDEILRYAKFFGLKTPALPEVPVLSAAAVRKLKAREAFLASPEHNATLVVDRARREMREDFARRRAAADAIREWRSGNPYARVPYGLPTMLRIRGNELETSMGVRVPIEHAYRVLGVVRQVVERKEPFISNGHTLPVGVYKVERIDSTGDLHAGCHHIAYAEIERIAPEVEAKAVSA